MGKLYACANEGEREAKRIARLALSVQKRFFEEEELAEDVSPELVKDVSTDLKSKVEFEFPSTIPLLVIHLQGRG